MAWKALKHMPTAIVPAHLRRQAGGRELWIETEDAYKMVRRLAREEGLLVGISRRRQCPRGACILGRELAAQGEAAVIVTVLCDGADKYLSEHFWDNGYDTT